MHVEELPEDENETEMFYENALSFYTRKLNRYLEQQGKSPVKLTHETGAMNSANSSPSNREQGHSSRVREAAAQLRREINRIGVSKDTLHSPRGPLVRLQSVDRGAAKETLERVKAGIELTRHHLLWRTELDVKSKSPGAETDQPKSTPAVVGPSPMRKNAG